MRGIWSSVWDSLEGRVSHFVFFVVSLMPVMSTRSRGIQNGKINKKGFETSPQSEREMDREREREYNTLHPNPKGNGKGKDASTTMFE